jgi:hypothetical protein
MTSPAQIEANRRNSLKSTGPMTPEGRARSSMNALKHGLRSKKQALIRDQGIHYEDRLQKWFSNADPVDDVGEFLVHQYVSMSFELERAQRAYAEGLEQRFLDFEERELDAVHVLGKRLFFDASGPLALYGNSARLNSKRKTSWTGHAVDPDDPALLVRQLESTENGCRWLLQCWEELRARLEPGKFWQSQDRFKAIRLLGRQPLDALEDRRVAEIFVASHALNPIGGAFEDLATDIGSQALVNFRRALKARWSDLISRDQPEACRQLLIDLADSRIEYLSARLELFEEGTDSSLERTFARLAFDQSPEGERLRKYRMRCLNAFYRGVETYRNYQPRKRAEDGRHRLDPARPRWEDYINSPDDAPLWPRGMAAQDHLSANAIDLGVVEAAAPEPPGACDPPTHHVAGLPGENATNEANPDDDVSTIQNHSSVELAANSAVDSALDKPEAQPAISDGKARCSEPESSPEDAAPSAPRLLINPRDPQTSPIGRLDPRAEHRSRPTHTGIADTGRPVRPNVLSPSPRPVIHGSPNQETGVKNGGGHRAPDTARSP